MSIGFFTPVVYQKEDKTLSERALEAVDEFFYFGDRFRVQIFEPNATHLRCWAMRQPVGSRRSWSHIAMKVVSYCTLVLPLIALLGKVILRGYLQVSSIQVHAPIQEISPEILRYMASSFLSNSEQAGLDLVARCTHSIYREDRDLIGQFRQFKADITQFAAEHFCPNTFQSHLKTLMTTLFAIPLRYWVPAMNVLMRSFACDDSSPHAILQKHADIASWLATFDPSISSAQIDRFCRYLEQNQFFFRQSPEDRHVAQYPWIGYRAFEQYSLQLPSHQNLIERATTRYLTQMAERYLRVSDNGYDLSNQRILRFRQTHIDASLWFGWDAARDVSLWMSSPPHARNNPETVSMPERVLDVLWTRIQSLRASAITVERPFMVHLNWSEDNRLPFNFALTLAQRITGAQIFLVYRFNTLDPRTLHSLYRKSIGELDRVEKEALAASFPRAVVLDTEENRRRGIFRV